MDFASLKLTAKTRSWEVEKGTAWTFFSEVPFHAKGIQPSLEKVIALWRKNGIRRIEFRNLSLVDSSFVSEILPRIDAKKRRQGTPMDLYRSLSRWERFRLSLSSSFRAAKKRERDLERTEEVDLSSPFKGWAVKAVENYVFGCLGAHSYPFTSSKSKVGRNLRSILMNVRRMGEEESALESLSLLRAVHLPLPEEILKHRFSQYINATYQAKILLAYLMAFGPSYVFLDCSSLPWKREVIAEISSTVEEFQRREGFAFLTYDDVLPPGDRPDRNVVVFSKNGEVLGLDEWKKAKE